MNMFYTGLGIARSLGERGVPVIGLSAQRIYGNYTRYARVLDAPDSRNAPEALHRFLLDRADEFGLWPIIFPTRDDDVAFLDRFRTDLEERYRLIIPPVDALRVCLSKWETYEAALQVGVSVPRCWTVENEAGLEQVASEAEFPCVLKPVTAHEWRKGGNWQIVGGRKAIPVQSAEELAAEYRSIAAASPRALVQELIPGPDGNLAIQACYVGDRSDVIAAFNTRKVLQSPEGFGTGCVVESDHVPELLDPSARLLRAIGFSGVAEIEYKWDARRREYRLIEINPRPWDQHRLGVAVGADVIYAAYCDREGLDTPPFVSNQGRYRWIAEDTCIQAGLRAIWRADGTLKRLLSAGRGRRIYAIWSWRDPAPFGAFAAFLLVPQLIEAIGYLCKAVWRKVFSRARSEGELQYDQHFQHGKTKS
jgi:predicted ATP-grasp superfamily ATP-dependent carboligase